MAVEDETTAMIPTSLASRLRRTARAILADADERASQLDAAADEIERGDDPWLTMREVGELTGRSPRGAREWLLRSDVALAPRAPRVKRSVVESKLASNVVQHDATRNSDPHAADRAAFARTVARIAGAS